MKTSTLLSYLFYIILILAFVVPYEHRLLDIKLVVPFNEYTITLTVLVIIQKVLKK